MVSSPYQGLDHLHYPSMNAVSTSDRGELVMLKSLPIMLATLHSKIYCAALLSENILCYTVQ